MSHPNLKEAATLKEKGNKLFKDGLLLQAQKLYAQAEAVAPAVPTYSSNLSAALYEQGKYSDCIDALLRSWSALHAPDVPADVALSDKLKARMAKALCHAVRSKQRDIKDISVPENMEGTDSWWGAWKAISSEDASIPAAAAERMRKLPIFKSAPDPVLEYYIFGHDDVMSLLDPWAKDGRDALKLADLKEERLSNLSFLFGGIGDARHAYGTFIDLHRQTNAAPKAQKHKFQMLKVHLTLVDVQPAALARDILILQLLSDLAHVEDAAARVEIKATIFYVFCAIVMPGYCHDRVLNTARELCEKICKPVPDVPAWLHVDAESVPAIAKILRYWSSPLRPTTTQALELHAAVFNEGVRDALFPEMMWYIHAKVLLPPRELLGRHPGFDSGSRGKRVHSGRDQHIRRTWKPNPTLFDGDATEHPLLSYKGFPPLRQNPLEIPGVLADFLKRSHRTDPGDESPAFFFTSQFFDAVADALEDLKDRVCIEIVHAENTKLLSNLKASARKGRPEHFPKEYTKIWTSNVPDYTNGIVNTIVYSASGLQDVPQAAVASNCLYNTFAFTSNDDFCHNYTLLRVADVPRFLGCRFLRTDDLTDLTVLAPLTHPIPLTKLASRFQLTTWLTRVLFGILINGNPFPLPRRVDLPNNLAALFTGLLPYLHKIGFPSHWLSDWVQAVLDDSIVTDIEAYTGRLPIPAASAANTKPAPRRVHLSAWHADIEAILARTRQALPFALLLRPDFPALSDIAAYRVTGAAAIDLRQHKYYDVYKDLASPTVRVVQLMFYKPVPKEWDVEHLAHQPGLILEGEANAEDGQVQVVLSTENVDLAAGVIEWRMDRRRVARMKAEGWEMAACRTDILVASTVPKKADEWVEV
ncbi:hypothetical protein PLICRDRAFT_33788 [Plicaturopsis crispa FD-325 SS-3]|nr:hypothetical protein PLICRDRAFT_33788 [Plicaturopsis crispa FD-325 SS-3]